jgi:phosphohistidine phosphatase
LQIYLLRHAIASPRSPERRTDDRLRPLTAEGKRKMRSASQGMKFLGLTFDLVLSSPLVRCKQTAGIVAARFRPRPRLRYLSSLAPGSAPADLIQHVAQLPASTAVLLVGHEPGLSSFAGLLLAGPGAEPAFGFKKGGLCRIDFPGTPQPGAGRLIYHLTPRILRRLSGRKS